MAEIWLPVPGWPYQVSNRGQVRSVDRVLSTGQFCAGTVLRQRPDAKGYMRVTLRDGKRVTVRRVHVLVAEAFLGPRPRGKQILHRDDDHARNDVESIRYGTPRQNTRERMRRERRDRRIEQKREKRETGEIEGVAYRVLAVAPGAAPLGGPR